MLTSGATAANILACWTRRRARSLTGVIYLCRCCCRRVFFGRRCCRSLRRTVGCFCGRGCHVTSYCPSCGRLAVVCGPSRGCNADRSRRGCGFRVRGRIVGVTSRPRAEFSRDSVVGTQRLENSCVSSRRPRIFVEILTHARFLIFFNRSTMPSEKSHSVELFSQLSTKSRSLPQSTLF